MTSMKFGECLSLLLSTLDISMNQLSKAINVDSSLVSRWVSGKRIPTYNTIYIDSITEYFSRNIKNSFQEQHLNKIFLSLNINKELDGDIKEKMKKVLLESQGYSIECKKKEHHEKKSESAHKDQVLNFVSMDHLDTKKQNNINDFNQTVDLSNEDKIVFGIENIVSAGISLLEAAVNHKGKGNRIIYITYNSISTTNNYSHKLIHWRNALLNAINNGWEVLFLLRLDNNINRIIRFINFIHPIMITGKLNLYYFNKYGISTTNKEAYVVSDVGALSCFPTEPHSEITCSFYLKNKVGVDVFKNYFNKIIANNTQPLVKYYSTDMEYHHRLTEFEENIGNRFQYKYCFSMFTLTENLFKKFLERKNLPNDEIIILLGFHKRQIRAFLSSIKYYQYKDIYLSNSIEDLIIYRRFYFDYYGETEIMTLEVEDIIDLLQNIIFLLKTYDNFSIAFMPKNTDNFLKDINSYCAVKERQSVVFETFNPLNNLSKVQLSIEENTLVKAFEEYFKQTWEQIPPINKDKSEIITMLQNQIDILKKTIKNI